MKQPMETCSSSGQCGGLVHWLAASIRAALCLILVFMPHLAEARWLRAESPLFVIYSEGSEEHLREFTRSLHDYDAFLRMVTGTKQTSPNKLTIYLVRHNGQIREINPYVTNTIAGFYLAQPAETMAVAISSDIGSKDWASGQSILFHEYTHHFILQYHAVAYPGWSQEGLAEYLSTAEFKADRVEVGHYMMNRVYGLRALPWIPMEKLFDPPRKVVGANFYPESWLVTHYMMDSDEHRTQYLKYLQALNRGDDTNVAFSESFGMDLNAFDRVMQGYLAKGKILIRGFAWKPIATPEISVTALPPSADTLLLLNQRLALSQVKKQDIDDVVKEVRRKTAPFGDDLLARRTLAMAEIIGGNFDKADSVLDPLIAQSPDDVETLFLKGVRYIEDGLKHEDRRKELWANARPIAARIYKIDANYYPALYMYALCMLDAETTPSPNTLNVILLAHELAPQVSEISIDAAVALARGDRVEEAKALLKSVAYKPHSSKAGAYARELLDKLGAGEVITKIPGEFPRGDDDQKTEMKKPVGVR